MGLNNLENFVTEHPTERLVLKTLLPEHYSDEYLGWLHDPEVIRYLELRHGTHTPENVKEFARNMLVSPDNLQMGIFLKDGGRHIGNIKLGPVNWRYRRADIGLMIGDKPSWGKGYASEAIAGICEIGFEELGLQRIQAGAYASNKGSIKAFLKAGFSEEGVLKSYWLVDGQPEDEILVGKTFR